MDTLIILCLLGDPTLPPVSVKHTGGYQVDIQELLYNLKDSSLSIHIITNTSEYSTKLLENNSNYTIHRIQFNNKWLEDQNELMMNFKKIRDDFFEIINEFNGKKVLIHSFYWLSGILALEAKKKYHIDYVHSVVSLGIGKVLGGSAPYYSNQINYEKIFLNEAYSVFSITQAEKDQLVQYYNLDKNKIIVVGRDVHPAFLEPCRDFYGNPPNIKNEIASRCPIELLKNQWWMQGAYTYIGRLQTIKGLQYIIVAWYNIYQKFGERTPPLWICGGTPERINEFHKELSAYIDIELLKKYEECQKIVWWGYLDPAAINTLFLKTRVLVTHSQYEPGGRVLLEALSASIPVIATPNGFAKDLITNKFNGYLVNYGCVDELVTAMEFFLLLKDEVLIMKKNAHNTYIKEREIWNCYRTQFQIYKEMGLNFDN